MKTIKFFMSALVALLVLESCSDRENLTDVPNQTTIPGLEDEPILVFQERNPELTTNWTLDLPESDAATRAYLPPEDYIGRAYGVGNSMIGEYSNATLAVIDLAKLKELNSTAVTSLNVNSTYTSQMAYTTYERYERNMTLTKTLVGGFNLNLKFFKLGRTKTTTEIFKEIDITEALRVYGEVGIEYRRGQHFLSPASVVIKEIAMDCLDQRFQKALFLQPISEILDTYGPLVITGYYTGGRASALYVGSSEYKSDFESTEKEIKKVINASYSNDTVKVDLTFGRKNENSNHEESKVTNMYCAVHTIGGMGGVNLNATKVDEMSVNLTPWLNSLSDDNSHVMIGLIEGKGLRGLSDFVIEENFKLRIQDTHLELTSNIEMSEPFIEIAKVYVRTSSSGTKLYEIAAILNTRQGDQIILNDGLANQASDAELLANNDYDIFMSKSQAIAAAKSRYYQCLIKINPNKTIDPRIRIPFNMSLPGFSEENMYKFKNEETNVWYVYNSKKRYAYSFYDFLGFIPEVYGIEEWVDSLPEKPISKEILASQYTIIGL